MRPAGTFGLSWSLSVAFSHVEGIELRDHTKSLNRAFLGDDYPVPDAIELTAASARKVRRRARDGMLMALRDGYIRATGRLSTTAALYVEPATEQSWRLHSSDPSLITTTEWRDGELNFSRWELTGPSWQYIQIEVPEFMVKAIWPDDVPEPAEPPREPTAISYTTPYLVLMQEAIMHFGLTDDYQSKKENLSDWFFGKQIEGEPISRNIANAMATLIRLPSAQRGGAKRVLGPDLRYTG
ncbi:hypothetical protein ABWH93_06410 [Seohaeicola saemankumensis]|uniref:hypothetical protein n=1 Tax=Seohaeicola saemankumensis TaxID=481181 RepID=UPI0035CF9CAC